MFNFFYHIIRGSISKRAGAILFFIVNLNETRAIIGSKSGKGGKLMDEKWQQLKAWIQESQYIVFFGGAGVSTESKIPDFRSEDGLYRQKYKYPPETIISHSFYMKNTEEFYRFYKDRMIYKEAVPNDAHRALAKLEQEGKVKAVITQNIDGLHQMAGSREVLELHGSVHRNYCTRCGQFYDLDYITNSEGVPRCTCGGTVKPDVVLYEEGLDDTVLRRSIEHISKADLLIVGGTSLAVYPAAGLIDYYRGKKLVLINRSATPRDSQADLIINDSIGQVLGAVAGIR
jgi:NAD-dependent deacetylase